MIYTNQNFLLLSYILFIFFILIFSIDISNAQQSEYDYFEEDENSIDSQNYSAMDYFWWIFWIFLALPILLVIVRLFTGFGGRAKIGFIVSLIGYAFIYYAFVGKNNSSADLLTYLFIGIIFLFIAIVILLGRKKKSPPWRQYHGQRKYFSAETREKILKQQKYRCASCEIEIYRPLIHYDHINGNRSDNRLSNCQALCPNCHALKTDEDRKQQ